LLLLKKKHQVTLSAADMTPSLGCVDCQEEVSTTVFICIRHVQMHVKIGEMKGREASLPVTMEHLKLSFYGTERLHLLASSNPTLLLIPSNKPFASSKPSSSPLSSKGCGNHMGLLGRTHASSVKGALQASEHSHYSCATKARSLKCRDSGKGHQDELA